MILCSLNNNMKIAELLGLVEYVSPDAASSPRRKKVSPKESSESSVLLKLKTSETLMNMLLRIGGFFTVSSAYVWVNVC